MKIVIFRFPINWEPTRHLVLCELHFEHQLHSKMEFKVAIEPCSYYLFSRVTKIPIILPIL